MSFRSGTQAVLVSAIVLGISATAGCHAPEDGALFGTSSKLSLSKELAEKNDPLGKWLFEQVDSDPDAPLTLDYLDVILGLATSQGCPKSSIRTFVIFDDLIAGDSFPRLVSTVCSDNLSKASRFFISASFEKANRFGAGTGEIDTQALELFAWDKAEKRYVFYTIESTGFDDEVEVEIEPERCMQCHTTPADLSAFGTLTNNQTMPALPIMNELVQPWSHWVSEPSFPNHGFGNIPTEITSKPSYTEIVTDFPGTANQLEKIIRAGQKKVVSARASLRRNPADLDQTLSLLRPLFCDEQINYIAEDFDSGFYHHSALVDPGIPKLFRSVKSGWPWTWANQERMRISTNAGTPVAMIPVRGEADIAMESRLVSSGVISALDALQIRALDWQNPVLSEFRCNLFKKAVESFETPGHQPDFSGVPSNEEAVDLVLDEILGVAKVSPLRGIGGESQLLTIPLADETIVALALEAASTGTLVDASCETDGFCLQTLDDWGNEIDALIKNTENLQEARTALEERRDNALCQVLRTVTPADHRFSSSDFPIRFPNRPALPKVDCQ